MRALSQCKTLFYENVFASRFRLPPGRPTISFTFDDVPRSALTNGVPILESHRIEGTFYVAGIFADAAAAAGNHEYLSVGDVHALHRAGHQIGCHTYSHRRLSAVSAREGYQDAKRNRELWEDVLGSRLTDFSYPFGDITVLGKRALRPCYATLRGVSRGINRGLVDLASLRAVPLYAVQPKDVNPLGMIDDCVANGGWLIFYTHGVTDGGPTGFDASVAGFRGVVEHAHRSGACLLNVAKAREYLLA